MTAILLKIAATSFIALLFALLVYSFDKQREPFPVLYEPPIWLAWWVVVSFFGTILPGAAGFLRLIWYER